VFRKEFWKVIWRVAKLLWKALWSVLVAASVVITLSTGWKPFMELSDHAGVTGFLVNCWLRLLQLLTDHGIGFLLVLVNVAILTYLVIDRSREKSRKAFEETRKKRPSKRKRNKK
jgi:peptidoglycan/LPS O-acetylase OafA/YrhL